MMTIGKLVIVGLKVSLSAAVYHNYGMRNPHCRLCNGLFVGVWGIARCIVCWLELSEAESNGKEALLPHDLQESAVAADRRLPVYLSLPK
jgi:hypothetical protein